MSTPATKISLWQIWAKLPPSTTTGSMLWHQSPEFFHLAMEVQLREEMAERHVRCGDSKATISQLRLTLTPTPKAYNLAPANMKQVVVSTLLLAIAPSLAARESDKPV